MDGRGQIFKNIFFQSTTALENKILYQGQGSITLLKKILNNPLNHLHADIEF